MRIDKARKKGKDTKKAEDVLAKVNELVSIPNAGGMKSRQILPDPNVVPKLRMEIAEVIQSLEE